MAYSHRNLQQDKVSCVKLLEQERDRIKGSNTWLPEHGVTLLL